MQKTTEQISYAMSHVRSKDTEIEKLLRKELWARGLRYRKNVTSVIGKPDIAFSWNRTMLSPDDPRKMLELHHVKHHKHGGKNTVDNLITLCNVCHDEKHRN